MDKSTGSNLWPQLALVVTTIEINYNSHGAFQNKVVPAVNGAVCLDEDQIGLRKAFQDNTLDIAALTIFGDPFFSPGDRGREAEKCSDSHAFSIQNSRITCPLAKLARQAGRVRLQQICYFFFKVH